MPTASCIILSKLPTPGQVKSRLCPPLTLEEAAEVHRASLRHTYQSVQGTGLFRTILAISPDDAGDAFAEIVGAGCETWPQGPGDLGQRLSRCIRRAMATKMGKVICLGADSPNLPASVLRTAVEAVDRADVVLGPCDDGGFYLLGLSRQIDGLFDGVAWGGPMVANQVRANAAALGVKVGELPPWYDIDRPADIVRVVRDLERGPADPDGTELLTVLRKAEQTVKRSAAGRHKR